MYNRGLVTPAPGNELHAYLFIEPKDMPKLLVKWNIRRQSSGVDDVPVSPNDSPLGQALPTVMVLHSLVISAIDMADNRMTFHGRYYQYSYHETFTRTARRGQHRLLRWLSLI